MSDDARHGEPRNTDALTAQLLATEHWSLLASRSTTQSEVLTRISMMLTLMSAALVSIALVGQATKFAGIFPAFADALLGLVVVVGVLTQVRVTNVSMEDLMYVLAMNRLRAEYVRLAPEVARALSTSWHDDREGVTRTYYFLGRRAQSQVIGSSMMFTFVVNGALVGLFLGVVLATSGVGVPVAWTVGIVCTVAYIVTSFAIGGRIYFRFWRDYVPVSPSEATPPGE
ncbi:hypothetical protein ACRAWC_02290 [Leifsonia sp. L25]|uniref:hypothetical protein n=1 Tax=Actinomycetes TaxID=1760 RepID=UPI003D697CD8